MSYITVKCDECGTDVIFDEKPYDNLLATRYWKSTYDEPEESMFVVQRRIPTMNKRGKMTEQILYEHILKIYCGPQCGLDDYDRTKRN